MKELCLGWDHADAVLGSEAVPRVAYGDSSALMPLRQSPHRHDLVGRVCVRRPQKICPVNKPVRPGWVAQRNQGGAAAISRAGDIRGATHPSLTGQHITQPYPVFTNAKP